MLDSLGTGAAFPHEVGQHSAAPGASRCQTPKCCSGGWLADFCPVQVFQGPPTSVPPLPAVPGLEAGPSEAGTSGCLIAAARRGKVHHGKMPGGLLTGVLWRAQLRKL